LHWLRCATSRTVPGSIPGGVTGSLSDIFPSDRTVALGSAQLVKMSTSKISWGVKAAGAWGWQPHHLHVSNVMEIWEPKPPGTLWATPGLLRDCFTFTFTFTFYILLWFGFIYLFYEPFLSLQLTIRLLPQHIKEYALIVYLWLLLLLLPEFVCCLITIEHYTDAKFGDGLCLLFQDEREERNLTFVQNIEQCLSVEQKAAGNSAADIKGERFNSDHSPPSS
jgi:hypothetical protein